MQLEKELKTLRISLLEMTMLVSNQMEKACKAFDTGNREIAMDVITNERRINAIELKIDSDCENILALHHPVAVDLRFVMAAYNICSTLERIADNADAIAKYVLEMTGPVSEDIKKELRIKEMTDTAISMLNDALDAYEEESPEKVYHIHSRDLILNEINIQSSTKMVELIKKHPNEIKQLLFIFSTIKKIERVGDLIKNIAEEIIFYIEAKVIKHMYSKNLPEEKN